MVDVTFVQQGCPYGCLADFVLQVPTDPDLLWCEPCALFFERSDHRMFRSPELFIEGE